MNLKRYSGIVGAILSLAVLAGGCLPNPADAAALDGTRWNVIALNGKPVTTEAEGTLDFNADNVMGIAFCNSFGGSYNREGTELTFGELEQTLMACIEPEGVMDLESAYMAALNSVQGYRMEEGNLVLVDDQGTELVVLSPATSASLEATLWQLTGYNEENGVRSLVPNTEITATFEDGTVGGTAGCNQYSASYTFEDEGLSIGPAVSTKMACMEPEGVMEQEAAFLAALSEVATYELQRSRLTLYNADGATLLTFVASAE